MQRMTVMKKMLAVVLGLLALATTMRADTYDKFKRTRYYSANRQYFVEVTKKRRATLHRNDRRRQRVWTRTLLALPGRLLVANDGSRVAIIDRYYGNAGDPKTPAVILLDERGNELASHPLSEVADLSRLIRTTSGVQWYRDVKFTPDGSYLVIETITAKRDPATCARVRSSEEAEECSKSVPSEELRFAIASGKLSSRMSIAATVSANAH
jgi:hypothetical protein